MMHTIVSAVLTLAFLAALAACLLSIGIALSNGTGTIKERILSAFNGMHSLVASFFALALPGGLVGFVSSLADLLNMPAVSGAMATLLGPKAIAFYTIAAAVLIKWARDLPPPSEG